MRYFAAFIVLLGSMSAVPRAHAVALLYGLKFTAETGYVEDYRFNESGPSSTWTSAAGNIYFGSFGIDSDVLAIDGLNKSYELLFLSIKMEDNIWSYNAPSDNSFEGFRGPKPGETCSACLGAPSPGIDVVGGAITNLRGGVYGESDVPFVDFSFFGANTFNAHGTTVGNPFEIGYRFNSVKQLQGRMDVFRIPEPDTGLLLSIGVVVFGITLCRRQRPRRTCSKDLLDHEPYFVTAA
jgi:hypothetical protein